MSGACGSEPISTNDYSAVEATFTKHCLDCHAAQDPEGKLVLESFETLMKGGENGPVIVPGKSAESLMIQLVAGLKGEDKVMPQKGERLTADQIGLLRAWIDQGANWPDSA